ncbi:MAG: hypothetical protein ACYS99_13470, partial [Planctomycetota bacterium]
MRNKAALGLLLIVAACGGSDAKAAFERYEKTVEPFLEEEADLRARFEDKVRDIPYGKGGEIDEMIRKRLVPFYREMAERVASVEPEGEELRAVHLRLVEYVGLRNEMYSVYGDLDSTAKETEKREEPAGKKVDEAQEAFSEKVQAIQSALKAAPEFVDKVLPVFRRADVMASGVFARLEGLRQGGVKAEDLLTFLEEQAIPFFEGMEKEIDELELGEKGAKVAEASKGYAKAFLGVALAAKDLAGVRLEMEEELVPLQKRFEEIQKRVEESLEGYLTGAKEYRA